MSAADAAVRGPCWALLPARSFRTGKSRLTHLGPGRVAVARALFEHVLGVLRASPAIAGVLVATDGDDTAASALARGADVLFDLPSPDERTLRAIVDRALPALARRGAAAAVVVMSDLPHLGGEDVAHLRGALAGADLVAAPDREQLGTNALAVRLPAAATCFGHADSYQRHVAGARDHGLRLATIDRDGLAFDLDGPADLDDLLAVPGARRPTEPEPWVPGQRPVRAEGGGGVGDAVERIAAIVAGAGAGVGATVGVRAVEHAAQRVQRGALGRHPPGGARGPA